MSHFLLDHALMCIGAGSISGLTIIPCTPTAVFNCTCLMTHVHEETNCSLYATTAIL